MGIWKREGAARWAMLGMLSMSLGCAGATQQAECPTPGEAASGAPVSASTSPAPAPAPVPTTSAENKPASQQTIARNGALQRTLPFGDTADFDDAKRGFLGTWPEPTINNAAGQPVWSLNAFSFLDGEAPPEVNPSLWRMAQLNKYHGLFQVTDSIYQVRGFDLAVMTIIEGKTGVVVVDPLLSTETAAAGLSLYRKHRGDKPVVAVIYTHSHADHFGGVRGVVDEKDVRAGKVKIVAPHGFLEHAVSENVFAGNAMSRRASYMYGSIVPKGKQGTVDAGLGKTTSSGQFTLIPPTDLVSKTGQKLMLAGLEFVFLDAPGSEAPSEFMFYLPLMKALCSSEDVTHTLHNLYTLRGAQVRDPLMWSRYLQDLLTLWGDDTQVMFASHHWPTWGNAKVTSLIKAQRDLYKYIHDQTLHMANQGYTMLEIAEQLTLPPELEKVWANRDYYGTLNHNVKAVYQRYLGWFDGNPSHLHTLPPEQAGKKYVELMGGADEVLRKAKTLVDEGDYRFAAEVLNHVVFAEPSNEKARFLLADVLEQMGYQAESGPWRGFYLTGAMELRNGVKKLPVASTGSADAVAAMTPEMFLDFMAVRLDAKKAAGKRVTLAFSLSANKTSKDYAVTLENGVLNYTLGKFKTKPDLSLTLDHATFMAVGGAQITLAQAVEQKKAKFEGDPKKLQEFASYFDTFEFWFPIVTP
jgi:alkyl sulfatase BDS1-like metallo-beta-lactamase superfamily hydrolase